MSVGNKIRVVREELGINQAELASMVSVSEKTIRRYEQGEAYKIDTLQKLANALDVDINYFLSDKLSKNVPHLVPQSKKKCPPPKTKMSPTLSPTNENVPQSSSDIVTISYYRNITASAGYGAINSNLEATPVQVTKDFLRNFFKLTSFADLEVITVYGDSMLPLLQNGETILIQRTHEVKNNQIIILRYEDEIYAKRFIKEPFSNTIKLISENKDYENITIPQEEFNSIEIIGVVKGSFRLR